MVSGILGFVPFVISVDYAQDKDALPMISDNPLVLLFKFDDFQFEIKKNTSL